MKGNISGREGPPDIGVKGIDSSFHPYLTYWVGIGTNGTRQGLLALRDTCTYFPELSFCTTMLFLSTREPDVEGRTLLSVASGPGFGRGEGMNGGMNALVRILLFSQAVGYN